MKRDARYCLRGLTPLLVLRPAATGPQQCQRYRFDHRLHAAVARMQVSLLSQTGNMRAGCEGRAAASAWGPGYWRASRLCGKRPRAVPARVRLGWCDVA